VLVRAEVGDGLPRGSLATLCFAHGPCADPATPDRISSTSHVQ
jgi:hypothetical protein